MRKISLLAVLVLMASGAQAATLDVVGGQLMGASNVLVDGLYYDVEFVDGTCSDLFSGCDDLSDFTFNTSTSALAAANALLDQVLIDATAVHLFDSFPQATNGIEYSSWGHVLVAFGFESSPPGQNSLLGYSATNNELEELDEVFLAQLGYTGMQYQDTGTMSFAAEWAYSRWSVVPEPSTVLLVGFGLAGLAGQGRRRNRS